MRRGSKPRGDWILTLNVPHCVPKPSLLIICWTVCCTEEQQASARSYVQPIPSSRLQNAVQVNSSHVQRSKPVYPVCRTLEQVQAHMANISASTLPSPVHKLPVVQYRACIYTERAMTYHPGLCWSCKADP